MMKPCPFCRSRSGDLMADTGHGSWWIVCETCGSRGPLGTSEASAWELWGLALRAPTLELLGWRVES